MKPKTKVPPVSLSTGHGGPWALTYQLMIVAFTRPVIVARASYRKARIRAQRDPIVSPAGTGKDKRYPRGSLVHQDIERGREDQATLRMQLEGE